VNISAIKIKQIRTQKGWSQDVLAKSSGISLRTIQRLERDGGGSAETLLALAAAFDTDIANLTPIMPHPKSYWTKEKLMNGLIAIVVILGALFSLLQLGGDFVQYWDFFSLIFIICLTASSTLIAFGGDGLMKSLIGFKFLFSGDLAASKATDQLAFIYRKQIWFSYGAALIAVIIGSISIHSSAEILANPDLFHPSYAVNIIVLLYSAILSEVFFRPLAAKLEASKLQ